jgi:hypothetical protein
MVDSKYRPYLHADEPVSTVKRAADRKQELSRWLVDDMGQQESEFEKPYAMLDPSARRMHLDIPLPEWGPEPSFRRGSRSRFSVLSRLKKSIGFFDIEPDEEIEASNDPECRYCILTCWPPNNCAEPIECHPSVFCTIDPTGNGTELEIPPAMNVFNAPEYQLRRGLSVARGGPWAVTDLKGKIKSVSTNTSFSFPSVLIFVDENDTNHLVDVRFTDGLGNICSQAVELTCGCACPPATAFTFDDASTADTIARNASITIYCLGGCYPYTWSVSGTGFSIPASTTASSNTLSADGTACGTATITATDYCGTALTIKIRCTSSGSWCAGSTPCNSGDPIAQTFYGETYINSQRVVLYARQASEDCGSGSSYGSYCYTNQQTTILGAIPYCANNPACASNLYWTPHCYNNVEVRFQWALIPGEYIERCVKVDLQDWKCSC